MATFINVYGTRFINLDSIASFEVSATKSGQALRLVHRDGQAEVIDCMKSTVDEILRNQDLILPAPSGYRVYFIYDSEITDREGWDVLAFAFSKTEAKEPPRPISPLGIPETHQPWCISKIGSGIFFDSCGSIWKDLDQWLAEYKDCE